ncbi:MAG: helix-turn-helix domain-containing protein [Nocardiaceae bacterium]|nr:helix-turn-helix domain-containing protein [Nocardiaceae bacterium]
MQNAVQVEGVIPPIKQGKRLEIAREYRGLSQADLAMRVGASAGTINRSERGLTKPRRPLLIAWALATGVSLEWLETGENYGSEGLGFESLRAHNWRGRGHRPLQIVYAGLPSNVIRLADRRPKSDQAV